MLTRIKLLKISLCCSVTQSCLTLCYPMDRQHARFPCPSPSPRAWSNSCPLGHWYHPTILSTVVLFSSCLHSFPASESFLMSWLFPSGGQVLALQLQYQSFWWIFRIDFLYNWLIWSSCSSRDSQESSPTPQLKSINSSVFSLLYGPTLTTSCKYNFLYGW